jgi:hypothetical protein
VIVILTEAVLRCDDGVAFMTVVIRNILDTILLIPFVIYKSSERFLRTGRE